MQVGSEGAERLLFELASGSRLAMLHLLQGESLKMNEIARRLDMTATEAFRQLERLSAASLIRRQPDGTFAMAEYGRLVMHLSSSLEFVSRHKDYFGTHEVTQLPPPFISRLGELSRAELVIDTIGNLNWAERALTEAEQYGWGIGEGTAPEHMGPLMIERIRKGVRFRFIVPEDRISFKTAPPEIAGNLEVKGLPSLSVLAVLTEKEAGVFFPQIGGMMDYTGFVGSDPQLHGWVRDLFLHCWERGKAHR